MRTLGLMLACLPLALPVFAAEPATSTDAPAKVEGVVVRVFPGVTSAALEKLATDQAAGVEACFGPKTHHFTVRARRGESGLTVEALGWERVTPKGRPVLMRGGAEPERCVGELLQKATWPLKPGERTLLSFRRGPHDASAGGKGWAFYQLAGSLDASGDSAAELDAFEAVREDLVRCGLKSLVGIYTAAGRLRAFLSDGKPGHRACAEKILRGLGLGSNSYGGEVCAAFGAARLKTCPLASILLSKDEPPGVVLLE